MAYQPYPIDIITPTSTITIADTGTTSTTGSNASVIYTGTATTNSSYAVNVANFNSYSLQITGTWVGTLQVENSYDNGVTWYRLVPQVRGVSNSAATISANGAFVGEVAAAFMLRVRATAWTSGTATIVYTLSPSTEIVRIDNPIRIYDNASSQQASIKPASTAPLAIDTALVTVESPNSSLTNPMTFPAGSASALNADLIPSTDVGNYKWMSISIQGTFSATYSFQGSNDNFATTAFPLSFRQISTGVPGDVSSSSSTAIAWQGSVPFRYVRVRITSYTSGTVTSTAQAIALPPPPSQFINVNSAPTTTVTGVTAAGSTVAGNPLRTGGLGKTTNPTAVADGQATNIITDKLGKQVVVGSLRDLKNNQVTTITSSTTETTIVTSVTGVFADMYGLIISNTSATAVNVAIKDATAGTTRFNISVPAGDTRGFMLPESGAMKQSAVTNNWTATCSASVTSVIVTALTVNNL